jgi:hypothetical protein
MSRNIISTSVALDTTARAVVAASKSARTVSILSPPGSRTCTSAANQCLELIYPGEPVKNETVSCARWNYNWHTIYNYEDDVAPIVPAGTLLHVITWFDNTPANKFNPDPKNWVGAGTGRTIDEMGFSWIGWYDLTDEEYKAELAARKTAQQQPRVTQQQQQQQQQ